jgi:hypothetical protein
MKTRVLAGAIAFAAIGAVLVDREIVSAANLETNKITDVNIVQIKGSRPTGRLARIRFGSKTEVTL